MEAPSAEYPQGELPQMKKLMIAALSLSLLSGTAVLFAQNTMDTASKATKKAHKKKAKKSTATDTMSSPK